MRRAQGRMRYRNGESEHLNNQCTPAGQAQVGELFYLNQRCLLQGVTLAASCVCAGVIGLSAVVHAQGRYLHKAFLGFDI